MEKWSVLCRINRHQILYILWLIFLLNVFTFKQLTVTETDEDTYEAGHGNRVRKPSFNSDRKVKNILLWNAWYGDFRLKYDDELGYQRLKCKTAECMVSKDKYLVPPETADAIIFLYTNLCDLPKIHYRKSHQRYVLLTDDPPICYSRNYYQREPYFGSFFNWTMSYRDDADIPWRKGWIKKKGDTFWGGLTAMAQKQMPRNFWKRKEKKLVAWYTDRCGSKSKREGYRDELKKHLQIDTYGGCGNLNCPEATHPSEDGDQSCLDYLAENYKFVLAFERFICNDFVSKRFFEVLRRDTVPIVFGGANYNTIAPANSFINALEMTPENLAAHLHMLDGNDSLYHSHFSWKGSYEIRTDYQEVVEKPMCDLCEKLHRSEPAKIYRDFDFWWLNSSKCSTPEEHGLTISGQGHLDLHDIEKPWNFHD